MNEGMDTTVLLPQWYALQVRPRWEKRVALVLTAKGYEHFLPLYSRCHQIMQGTRRTDLPLFPGYIFCRFNLWCGPRVVTCPGVLRIVSFGKVPVPVPEYEIDALRRTVAAGMLVEPHPFLYAGQSVRLLSGPLAGVTGVLVGFKSRHRLVISVSLLQRSVSVELDSSFTLEDIGTRHSVLSEINEPQLPRLRTA